MSLSRARLLIAVADPMVVIKISGWANSMASVDFKTAVYGLQQRGFYQFLCDLSECQLMDSTFLGILAGFSLKLAQPTAGASVGTMQLLNPNQRIADALDNLGIGSLFKIIQGSQPGGHYVETNPAAPDRLEISRASLEAHQTLMAIDPANIPKFKDVTQFLADDLHRLGQKRGQAL